MGKAFLEGFSAILPPSQQKKLYDIMTQDQQTASSEQELEALVSDLLNKIGKHESTMQIRKQEDLTSSQAYNQTLMEILSDLTVLYSESDYIDRAIFNNHKLNMSVLDSITRDIKRLERKIDSLNLIADNTDGYSSASMENFDDESKTEKLIENNQVLFTDKDGSIISPSLTAYVNKDTSVLELATINTNFDRLHLNGNTIAKIEILEQTGQSLESKDSAFSISRAIDNDLGSFWGEVILTDEPIKIPMDNITGGAICKFRITLPAPVSISEFVFSPYTEYPIELISMSYSANDSGNITGYIKPYDKSEPVLIDSTYRYSFPAVLAKSVTVTLRQIHSTKHTYSISREQLNNKNLWKKVNEIETKITLETPWAENPELPNPSVAQETIEQMDTTWQEYLKDYNRRHGVIAAADLLDNIPGFPARLVKQIYAGRQEDPEKPQRVQVDKFEYIYGAYDIQLNGKEYCPKSIYVSKPYKFNGNVQQVVLEAQENHPVFYPDETPSEGKQPFKKYGYVGNELRETDDPLRRTSIEYYVSAVENPDVDDWHPILPLGQERVNQELLLFRKSTPSADLRFPVDTSKPFAMFKDEEPLLYGRDWSFASDESTPQSIEIASTSWESQSLYTIDYYPAGNNWVLDFSDLGLETHMETEYFLGTDKNCSIKLSKYPYIDRAKLIEDRNNGTYNYNPVTVTLNPSDMPEVASKIFNMQNFNQSMFKINGNKRAITSPILSTRDPSIDPTSGIEARLLNVTNYSDVALPALKAYTPKDQVPTFEYFHDSNRIYFTETFRHDGPVSNYETSHGNAIIKVDYECMVSSVRVKIILRRTSNIDTSVSPSVDWYTIKCRSLT